LLSCFYKKTFLKDLAKLPIRIRKRIETLVFEVIPESENPFQDLDVKKMKSYQHYYRIRTGDYRIGFKMENADKITFYRVKSRADIYKFFP